MEGSRPLLVEVQALVAPAGYGTPARRATGVDASRLALIVAVLGRRAGVALGTQDIYANLAGGLEVAEPGLDLPLALALASSLRDRPVTPGLVAVGEVGLLGELRAVPGVERRLREAARLGFTTAIVPAGGRGGAPAIPGLDVYTAATVRDAIRIGLGGDDPGGPDQISGARRGRAAGTAGVVGR
jgi:DNA repair protein RadA/Sms